MLSYYVILLFSFINITVSYEKTFMAKLMNFYNTNNSSFYTYNVTNNKLKDKECSYDSYSHII